MSAIDAWMKLQMDAILGDAEALAMVDKVSAEVGANPTEAQRVAVWQHIMLKEGEKRATRGATRGASSKPPTTEHRGRGRSASRR
jgi:hypothetical protein